METSTVVVDRALLPKGLFRSIRTKLIVYFSALFVVALILIGLINFFGIPFTIYSGRLGQQREEAAHSLNLVADMKKERLLRWIDERRGDAHMIATNKYVRTGVGQLIAATNAFSTRYTIDTALLKLQEEENYQDLVDFLNTIRSAYGVYDSIYIADARTGTIWVSTDDTRLGTYIYQSPFFSGALNDGHFYLSDIELSSRTQRPDFHLSHVITDEADEAVAVLVMEVSADDIFTPMLHIGEGLGARGEALLVNRDVRILTSLKHPLADGSIAQPLAYQIQAQPAVLAARGEEGIIESEDYRGEPVLAAYRHLEVSSEGGWGLVVKRDQAELFAPLRQDILFLVLVGSVGVIALVGFTIVIAASLTRPVRSLSWTARKVAEGQLEARAPVTTSDEVGLLAVRFNAMIERIQNWQRELEAQVKARTAELGESEQRYRFLFENMLNGYAYCQMLFEHDQPQDFIYLDVNPAFETLTGLKNVVGQKVSQIIPGIQESNPELFEIYGRVALTGKPERFETYLPSLGIWFSISVFSPAKEYFVAVFDNITEHKQAEERFRLVVEVSPSAIILVNAKHQIALVNAQAEALFGYTREELIGQSIDLLVPPSSRPDHRHYRDGYSAAPQVKSLGLGRDLFGWRKDGGQVPVEVGLTPVTTSEGVFVLTTIIDITERKRADEALRKSRERYQILFNSMLDGYALHEIICDEAGTPIDYRFLDLNPAYERLTGLSRDIIDHTVREVLPGIEQHWIDTYGHVALTGESIRFENHAEEVGSKWFEVVAFSPAEKQFATIFQDVTERKLAELERERLNRELMDKNKELEQIVYVTSHDLRSPLVNIQGFSKELDHAFKDVRAVLETSDLSDAAKAELAPILAEDIPEALQYIFASTNKMDSLLSGLLRLSRLGRAALKIVPLDMNRVVAAIVETFEFRIKEAGVKIQVDDLPPCLGDEAQLNQVFSNLLDNALKYQNDDCSGHIRISGQTKDKRAIYCVADNGIGIAADHQAKIYDLFHRLNPENGEGEGLGLTIVHRILDRHRGKIWVESQPGLGSKFFISLPTS